MPTRKHFLVTNSYYHLYNKTLEDYRPLKEVNLAQYFLDQLLYYRHEDLKISYYQYSLLNFGDQQRYLTKLRKKPYKYGILAYTIMPNHFHLLVKQNQDNGISSALRDSLNSFTKHYNSLSKRKGPLFLPRFKSKQILSEEQLIHVSRYIHLNPFSAGLIQTKQQIWSYRFSSAKEYMENKTQIINTKQILNSMYFLGSFEKYRAFVEDEAEASRTRKLSDHVTKWNH